MFAVYIFGVCITEQQFVLHMMSMQPLNTLYAKHAFLLIIGIMHHESYTSITDMIQSIDYITSYKRTYLCILG